MTNRQIIVSLSDPHQLRPAIFDCYIGARGYLGNYKELGGRIGTYGVLFRLLMGISVVTYDPGSCIYNPGGLIGVVYGRGSYIPTNKERGEHSWRRRAL